MSFPIRSHPFLQIRDREVQGIWKGLLTYGLLKTSRACRIPVHEKKKHIVQLEITLATQISRRHNYNHSLPRRRGDNLKKKTNKMQVMCKVLSQTAVSWCSRVFLAFIVVVVVFFLLYYRSHIISLKTMTYFRLLLVST